MFEQYVIPGDGVFPEGITEGIGRHEFYVSASAGGAIYRGDTGRRELEPWLPGGEDGRVSTLGLALDGHGRILICGGRSKAFYAYNLSSGDLEERHEYAGFLNDVCVHGGFAYLTDSHNPRILRAEVGEKGVGAPELWLDLSTEETDPFFNGIVPTPDGSAIVWAAQGSHHLWRAAVSQTPGSSGKAEMIDVGDLLIAGDGMVFVGDVLYICDNTDEADGSARFWLTALTSSDGWRSAELAGRWERPAADTPTTVAHRDGRLLLVNSQFVGRDKGTAAAPFTVSAVPLPTV
ncbi:hypothetical protein Afil01_11880 [Actinorhabdospora filicis]|uniref:Superoxide dismutase n=1 Tax=Actinorhabdospora filicis TaxID=1785913 RepID=A0A9W6SIV8_9ACTN|nr:hypothetical protein [Actinorhabdospora filicis]GLZ76381.1 hypothetical protein Afil01_11880 [Actinorhabdospora filicis]